MERLDLTESAAYNSVEACIHLNRYAVVKPFCEGATILDVACGQGYGSYLMRGWGAKTVIGIDIDKDTVEQASRLFQREGLCYRQHTGESLPFDDASFDVVAFFETIEHVNEPDAFLKEIRRVLKPGGTVIISCCNDKCYCKGDSAKNLFYKRECTLIRDKDQNIEYLAHVKKLENECSCLSEKLSKAEEELKRFYHNLECDSESLSTQSNESIRLQQELDGQVMANARLTGLLELTRQERDQLRYYVSRLEAAQDLLHGNWKGLLIRVLRKAKRIVKRILRKNS